MYGHRQCAIAMADEFNLRFIISDGLGFRDQEKLCISARSSRGGLCPALAYATVPFAGSKTA
jgi:hypothetical protein